MKKLRLWNIFLRMSFIVFQKISWIFSGREIGYFILELPNFVTYLYKQSGYKMWSEFGLMSCLKFLQYYFFSKLCYCNDCYFSLYISLWIIILQSIVICAFVDEKVRLWNIFLWMSFIVLQHIFWIFSRRKMWDFILDLPNFITYLYK